MQRLNWFFLFALCSCLEINPGAGADGGAAPPSAVSSDAGDGGQAATGVACAMDSISGVTLCTTISLCPGVAVDHDLYPECGFRITGGTTLDLECICGDAICALGIALTCEDAARLLSEQSELVVCTQVSEGRCAARGAVKTPPAGTGCDRACEGECGSDLGCVKACGC